MFEKTKLFCCICGKEWQASAGYCEGNFDQGTCSVFCFKEKEWRKVLSIMGKKYYPKYFHCKECEEHKTFPHIHSIGSEGQACTYDVDTIGPQFACNCQGAIP